jgi:hypothetical protein
LQVKSPTELKGDSKWEIKDDSQCDYSTVYLEGTNVQGSAEFVRSNLCGISMTGAHVTKNVDLLGSTLALFDFSGSTADGDLQIGPSRGPPMQLPAWLPAFGSPPRNLVLSHSSVALVRVALNNCPNMCNIGVKPKDGKDKCVRPSEFEVDWCTEKLTERPPSDLPDRDDDFISKVGEWTGFGDLIPDKNEPTTILADFRFKAFGKPFFCAWWDEDPSSIRGHKKYRKSDYVLNDATIDENQLELWLASTQYSPAEYQLISDLLVTNGQSPAAKKIGYAGKIIETRLDFEAGAWLAGFAMLLWRWTIGYGYYLDHAFLWAIFFCAIGAYIFSRAPKKVIRVNEGTVESIATSGWRKYVWGPARFRVIKYTKGSLDTKYTKSFLDTNEHVQDYGVINPIGYSFDALLPIIRLRELHYQVELGGWRHYYFYFQRIVGWILGIFVLGALSGLAK